PDTATGTVTVSRNGTSLGTFAVAGAVHVYSGGGNNTVRLTGTAAADTVDLYDETLTFNGLTIVGDGIAAWVVDGQGGGDSITVYDGSADITGLGGVTFVVYGGSTTL